MRARFALVALIVVLVALIAFNYYSFMPKGIVTASVVEKSEGMLLKFERIRYTSRALVAGPESEDIGFDIGNNELNFGLIPAGGGGSRFLDVGNSGDTLVKIKMSAHGNISRFITFGTNDFILQPGQAREIEISFSTSIDTEEGEYTGEIDVTKITSKISIADGLLGWM
jgi:hypothetical protein